jgi:nitrogen fixation/metabolism regulation signal transduction histidine kinase
MRYEAAAIASDKRLQQLVEAREQKAVVAELRSQLVARGNIVSVSIVDSEDRLLASVDRGTPLNEEREHQLMVVLPLADAALQQVSSANGPHAATASEPNPLGVSEANPAAPQLHVLFATPKARFLEFAEMGEFIEAYGKLEARRSADEETYLLAFSALLGVTIVAAVSVGILLARSVTRRISKLANATRRVGAGDLSIRVSETHPDEIGDLSRAFNRMLAEVANSRDRIEYLSRLASWQEMAKRLAHEIKNPLTPIQLAVQEVHRRLSDVPADQRALLDITLEIVQTEVQTLHRLVSEFSEFARLPESKLERADLFQFLREMQQETDLHSHHLATLADAAIPEGVNVNFELPSQPAPVQLDRQMMRRVLVNLIRNAVQACARASNPSIAVSARRAGSRYEVFVDDNGPGVPAEIREHVFEPYMTTKENGTGLGLAIVKKIVIDHAGTIEMLASPSGGARVRLALPIA